MSERIVNWARSHTFSAARVHRPASVEEVSAIVAGAGEVKALGTRHSFNDIADTDADLVDLTPLNRILEVAEGDDPSVLVEAGIRYGDLAEALWPQGYTLANFASLPHISVGGTVATGTHGSGVKNGSLSTAVREIELVKADGTPVTLRRGQDREFDGAVINVGALGIVTRLRLDLVPAFDVAQTVYEGLRWKELEKELDAVLSGAYSVSLFTTWTSDLIDQVWVKRIDEENPADYFGAKAADGPRHPLPDLPTENCTEQMGVPGPAFDRLPHFRLRFTPSGGEELQAEYILSRARAFEAMMAIDGMREEIAPFLFVSEIRTVAADDLWLSSSYGVDSVCIHFTLRPMPEEVRALLPKIQARLAPLGARPHWGKLFSMPVADRYPKLEEFRALATAFDPERKFRNAFLERTGLR